MNVSDDANVEAIRKQETRESATNEMLGGEALEDFEAYLIGFRRLQPRIEEIQRRFKILSKESKVGGTANTIEGCKNFKEWCENVLGKPVGVVYYLLRGGPKKSEPKEKSDELLALKFSKEEKQSLVALFETHLSIEATKKDKEELLHILFTEMLNTIVPKGEGA
jgi:hypothetical protein